MVSSRGHNLAQPSLGKHESFGIIKKHHTKSFLDDFQGSSAHVWGVEHKTSLKPSTRESFSVRDTSKALESNGVAIECITFSR